MFKPSVSGLLLMIWTSTFAGYSPSIKKLPLIYSKEYNIQLMGIQRFHPFDTEKYRKVHSYLKNQLQLTNEHFYEPDSCNNSDLLIVHPQTYIDTLKHKDEIARIAELPALTILPRNVLYKGLLRPMKYGTGGTILGVDLALKKGWAINLSGGYHHAKATDGSGFCFFADIPIALYKLWQKDPNKRVLIIDLDAHQGNGFASILKDDKRVAIFDIYAKYNYPMDESAKQYIDYEFPMGHETLNSLYINLLEKEIVPVIAKEKPDLIIYNAGTDIYKDDPLGCFRVTAEGVIKRDHIVFEAAIDQNIPILMVLSGGYTKASSTIIGRSIVNLIENVIPGEIK